MLRGSIHEAQPNEQGFRQIWNHLAALMVAGTITPVIHRLNPNPGEGNALQAHRLKVTPGVTTPNDVLTQIAEQIHT
jgi:hypothetical protein